MKSRRISSNAPVRAAPPVTNDQIAALAHAIWMDRGCPFGRDLEHWYEAERQLRGEVVIDDRALDPSESNAARIDRELERVITPPEPRSPTSL
jgi:hypothetical protein